MSKKSKNGQTPAKDSGLCFDCRHAWRIRNDRGSRFYMCQLSASDPRFDKYPRLPVLSCPGYEPGDATQSE